MLRFVGGVVVASVVIFLWGFVFWGLSPFTKKMMQRLPNEESVLAAFKAANMESGNYFVPFPECDNPDKAVQEAFLKAHAEGPLVQIIYLKDGVDPTVPTFMAFGFVHILIGSTLAAALLTLALPGLEKYPARVMFVFLLGVFASFSITLARPIWFHQPWPFALFQSGYEVVSWLLAGLVLAAFIRPKE